ncbi:hypothetical protein [Sodalis sp. dw_96]|nr:hypothetical protein [Sodalis sp. dw_96]
MNQGSSAARIATSTTSISSCLMSVLPAWHDNFNIIVPDVRIAGLA